jgi:putative transcriptional regulator
MITNLDNSSLSLKGHLLLAMPRIGDPRFHQAVIFICVHDEKGAMGIGINEKLAAPDFESLLDQLGIVPHREIPAQFEKMPIIAGGPVEGVRGFLLHSSDFHQKDTIEIDDQFGISGTIDSLRAALSIPPRQMLFALGYAGWGPGQIEQELQDNAWLTVPATYELVFNTRPEDIWEKAFSAIGISPSMLSGLYGTA